MDEKICKELDPSSTRRDREHVTPIVSRISARLKRASDHPQSRSPSSSATRPPSVATACPASRRTAPPACIGLSAPHPSSAPALAWSCHSGAVSRKTEPAPPTAPPPKTRRSTSQRQCGGVRRAAPSHTRRTRLPAPPSCLPLADPRTRTPAARESLPPTPEEGAALWRDTAPANRDRAPSLHVSLTRSGSLPDGSDDWRAARLAGG